MKLDLRPLSHLPVLAWGARLETGSDVVTVYHGSGVLTRRDTLVEGVWDGPFEAFDPIAAQAMAGTAVVCGRDALHLRPGSDRLTPIYRIQRGRSTFLANSPIFATALAGDAPHPLRPFYPFDWLLLWRAGLEPDPPTLRLRSGARMAVHLAGVATIRADGTVETEPGPTPPSPTSYAAYRALVVGTLERMFANARAPERPGRFEPLATLSRGYDSSAVAVLARDAGCREALTFTDSRRGAGAERDCGLENARRLGLACEVRDRWDYLHADAPVEAELGITTGVAAPMAGVEDRLRGRLVLMGHMGELAWSPDAARHLRLLAVPWARRTSGAGQCDLRLRVGYVPFSPAVIGLLDGPALHRIGVSDEMRPWRLGGGYDRPIARRICEEGGLPRGSFAVRGFASGHANLVEADRYSEKGLRSYRDFVARSHAAEPLLARAAWRLRAELRFLRWRVLGSARRRQVPSTRWQRRLPFVLNSTPDPFSREWLFRFQWAFATLRERYRTEPESESERPCTPRS